MSVEIKEHFIREWPASVEECRALLERYDGMVRSLCCWLSVGGYNNESPKSPERAEEDIRAGIDMLTAPLHEAAQKYWALNTPEITDFLKAVEREALHQRERWGTENGAGKTDADWFWLIGHLAGKALHKPEKQLHHIITTAAVCLNWHAARTGAHTAMRPGIADPDVAATEGAAHS